ncbi:MAG: hypothetical protein ACAI34_19255 [Verrucomicrobium sp.]|nr:hypothetical protein [Verrucomicrobium sp.]
MKNSPLLLAALTWCLAMTGALGADRAARWEYLENEHLKIGIDLESGASIGWLSLKESPEKNVLNSYDKGRYVQQSYYGDPDGSEWNGTPWRYNPVQGGGWRGEPAKVLEFQKLGGGEEGTARGPSLFARIQPRHWATGAPLPEVVMTQTIILDGPLARVTFGFSYQGEKSHKAHHQELPAFFVQPEFDTLVYSEAQEIWKNKPLTRSQPGQKNEYVKLAEPWLAWVNPAGLAVGILSPGCELATCYRFPGSAACSYAAPLKTIALTPGFKLEYDAWLGIGTVESLREQFCKAAQGR